MQCLGFRLQLESGRELRIPQIDGFRRRKEPLTTLKIEMRLADGIAVISHREGKPVHLLHSQSRRHLLRRAMALLATLAIFGMPTPGSAVTMPRDDREADPLATLPGVLTAGADHVIKHWDMSGKLAATVGSHDDAVNAIAFVPGSGGTKLASVGADGRLKVWDTQTAIALQNIDTRHGDVTALALSPDGRLAATGGSDHQIRIWNLATGRMLSEVKAHGDTVRAMQFTLDGARLVSGSADRLIRIWRVENGGKSLEYNSTIVAHDDAVTGLVLTSNDQIASVSADGYLKFWEQPGGGLKNRVRVGNRPVLAIAISPDGRTIATGDEDGKIRLWNEATGTPLPFVGSHDRAVYALAWTPDGNTLVSGSEDKTVRYWSTAGTGHQVARITAHDGAVKAIAVVPQ
jgi:WD40 repeat protein